jgi:glycosyltransferase involved in cell wall biosynthesis
MKILEAAALGSPIITTKVGIEGIDMISASIVADSPKEFANGLIRLLTQESLRKNLCQAATEIYTEKYSRDSLTKKRENIYNELIQNK